MPYGGKGMNTVVKEEGGFFFSSLIPGPPAMQPQLLLNSPSSPTLSHLHPIFSVILNSV